MIAIDGGENAEDLETADDVLNHDAVGGQNTIVGSVIGGQGAVLAGLLGAISPFVVVLDALKTRIHRTGQVGAKPQGFSLEQSEVVGLAPGEAEADDLTTVVIHDHLGFQGVALPLAAVELPLFF